MKHEDHIKNMIINLRNEVARLNEVVDTYQKSEAMNLKIVKRMASNLTDRNDPYGSNALNLALNKAVEYMEMYLPSDQVPTAEWFVLEALKDLEEGNKDDN